MRTTFNAIELALIKKIAWKQIYLLMELEKHPQIIKERLLESKTRGHEVDISDYYEDIAESLQIWEDILKNPDTFLDQEFDHNYDHIIWVMKNEYKPKQFEKKAFDSIINKIILAKNINQN